MMSDRRLFLKQMGFGAIAAGVLSTVSSPVAAAPWMTATFRRVTPESQGVASSGISAFIEAAEKETKLELHSLMVLRHGNVIAEGWWAPYAAPYKHTLYSLSKSFTSTAVGLAITEGRFKLDTPVISFFPDDKPEDVSPNLAAMTVRHLLMMGTGHEKDTLEELRNPGTENWVKKFLSLPVKFEPGTHFVYNTGSTYMQAAIVQKVTGMMLIDYLKPRLFDPLEIVGMDWETSPNGVNLGGYGLRVRTEDIAKLGQLYLQKGMWNGKRILPAEWVEDATKAHIDNSPAVPKIPKEKNDWSQGYGYQFWRCTHNAFRGDGAFGQFCIVLPEKDAIVVMTSESFDLQESMNLVWEHLYPAMQDKALPSDRTSEKKLTDKLKKLELEPPKGTTTATEVLAKQLTSPINLDMNDFGAKSIQFKADKKECLFTLTDDKGVHSINCGIGRWENNPNYKTQTIFPIPGRPVVTTPLAASVIWTDPNTLMMTWRFTETAHSDNFIFTFGPDKKVTIKFLNSVAKGNPNAADKRADIAGSFA
jgi:CubicO group peptidase (beta-lactamase class C family)